MCVVTQERQVVFVPDEKTGLGPEPKQQVFGQGGYFGQNQASMQL
jgi:hypothetical protein